MGMISNLVEIQKITSDQPEISFIEMCQWLFLNPKIAEMIFNSIVEAPYMTIDHKGTTITDRPQPGTIPLPTH
jgi:hypothetical protein